MGAPLRARGRRLHHVPVRRTAQRPRGRALTTPKRHAGKRKSRNQKERERKSDQKPGAKKDETRKTKRPNPKPAQTYPPNQSHIADQKYSKQERKTSHIGTLEISQAKRQSRQTRQKYNLHNPTFALSGGADREKRGPRTGFPRLRAHRRTACRHSNAHIRRGSGPVAR